MLHHKLRPSIWRGVVEGDIELKDGGLCSRCRRDDGLQISPRVQRCDNAFQYCDGVDVFLLSGMGGVTIFIGPCSVASEGDHS
jgi:hypothetical protein